MTDPEIAIVAVTKVVSTQYSDPVFTWLRMRCVRQATQGRVGVRVVKSIKLCLVMMCGALVVCGVVLAGLSSTAGQARGDVLPPTLPPPLAAPSSGLKLTQVAAGTWRTTIYLNTSALCLGTNEFSLVTAVPYSSTMDAAPDYPAGLRCPAQDADPLTEVVLTFTPSPALSSVPQTATLTVTPPVSAAALGAAPLEVPLTIRRTVSAYQYVWIPVGGGAALAALLVVLVALTGVPDQNAPGRRLRGWQPGFWRETLFASATWTFGDSWATNTAAVTAVVAAVLSASGSVGGLIPGVDLGRFGLMMALAGGVIGIAPLFFGVLNSWFADRASRSAAGHAAQRAAEPPESWAEPPATTAPALPATSAGTSPEVKVSAMWVMLVASCLTVSGIGAELAIVGWVLGHDLMVAPALARWASVVTAGVLALLFLGYGTRAVITLADPEGGSPLNTAKSAAFIL
jgi:hypothetical protein